MAEQIIDGTGSGYLVAVTPENRLKVDLGGDVTISGVLIDSIVIQETDPTDSTKNNPAWKLEYIISGTTTGATGSSVGSVTMFIGAGSFVNVITYNAGLVTNIGSYS